MRTSLPAPESVPSECVILVEDWEKRSMDASDRFEWAKSDDSKRREIGSSDVKVSERKRVEKSGTAVYVL